ncbi:MAG: primosomal protein N' [Alphaproteobacteria bacterium]|nr:primosomal protein N' [Alphaproteobacteria bacterium]
MTIINVLLPLAIADAYSYLLPDDLHAEIGDFVEVPLGSRKMIGVVWPDDGKKPPAKTVKLKTVIGVVEMKPLPLELIKFLNWVCDYYISPKGMGLRLVMNVPEAIGVVQNIDAVRMGTGEVERSTKARDQVLDICEGGETFRKSELAKQAGVSVAVVNGLLKMGALSMAQMPKFAKFKVPKTNHNLADLADDQHAAADTICQAVAVQKFETFLLDGVTGSGKTEVYFAAIAKAIEQGKQAVVLLPEIALTVDFLQRFENRFGVEPAPWHSGLAKGARERVWRAVASGEAKIVIGARSALFLPFDNLGLIVVDEEHDGAYKQDSGVMYHARDMAVVKANIGKFPLILASATPSLETYLNATSGRYTHLVLDKRHGGAKMPHVRSIDLREHQPESQKFLSEPLITAMKAKLAAGEQSLLFLNRRGYAPLTLCRACGHRIACPQCDAWLVEHRFNNRLMCHHCGISIVKPTKCTECEAEDKLVACGPGVERIFEEVELLFPEARIELLSSDIQMNVDEIQRRLNAIAAGECDIIIGTQMIAKGHHFPHLTLVGVVDADLGLENGDPRAAERTYQLLNQVAGRAGREQKQGMVLLQTYMPQSPVMRAMIAQDREAFYKAEAYGRELANLPPFGRLASIIVSSKEQKKAFAFARTMIEAAPKITGMVILGPAPAPMGFVRGRHRVRVLARAPKGFKMQDWLKSGMLSVKPSGDLKVQTDTDPYSFF